MKNYQSTVEGVWLETVNVALTNEQRTLLISTEEEDLEAKTALRQLIQSQRQVVVETEKATFLNDFYQKNKPTLKLNDTYQLISIDISEPVENVFSGILNCRVNEEHKQLRF